MKNLFRIVLPATAIVLCSGCASIVSGTNQPLSVETRHNGTQVTGANCKLVNDKGTWFVTTPGSITVHRSSGDLNITCEKDGIDPGTFAVKSTTKGMAYGNILFGGIIGAGVDIESGAAFDYPSLIQVEMGKPSVAVQQTPAKRPDMTDISSHRKLSGKEIVAQFRPGREFQANEHHQPFTLKILENDNWAQRYCPGCNVQLDDGRLQVQGEEGKVCFNWTKVTYPDSGCYQVFQTDQTTYLMESLDGGRPISYRATN